MDPDSNRIAEYDGQTVEWIDLDDYYPAEQHVVYDEAIQRTVILGDYSTFEYDGQNITTHDGVDE